MSQRQKGNFVYLSALIIMLPSIIAVFLFFFKDFDGCLSQEVNVLKSMSMTTFCRNRNEKGSSTITKYPNTKVYFDSGDSELSSSAITKLKGLLNQLSTCEKCTIQISGYTDQVSGTGDRSHEKLSLARAESVKSWLNNHGIASERIHSNGLGHTQMVRKGDGEEDDSKNRRVEIKIFSTP